MTKETKSNKKRLLMYRERPDQFIRDMWPGAIVWDKLEEICIELARNNRIAIPSGHGVGKTWLLGRLVLWFLYCHYPSKVISTAPTWGQVENLLWSEVRTAYNTAVVALGGRLLQTEIKIDDEWFALGFSTRGKAADREFGTPKFQGYHSPNMLVIMDEAPGIEHEIWTSIDALIVGDNNKLITIGNPTSPTGDFYDACLSPLYKKINISCFDHPNVKEGKIIVPGAVTREWIEERRQVWGDTSPLWATKVMGEFPTEGEDTLIPLAWAEACVNLDLSMDGPKSLGVDVARYGMDKTALAIKIGQCVQPIESVNKKNTSWTTGRVLVLDKQYEFDAIGIDDTGVGGGVTDSLEDEGLSPEAINFGSAAVENDKFENLVSEMYWNFREDIQKQQISIPDDKELISQLCGRKFSFTRKGRIKIESKDDLRKRGLPSPDKADAVVIAANIGRQTSAPSISIISVNEDDDEL